MIYVTGDCHGDYKRFNMENFPEQKNMTKDDFVIICGDFGFWTPSNKQNYNMKWLKEKNFTTLFVDGNHECFDDLYKFEVKEFCGGKAHFINDSVIHLMRGQVFTLQDRKFFTFGGARSHDIDGGILEKDDKDFKLKKKQLEKKNLLYRVNHVSWWKEEMPNEEEYQEGIENLEKNDWTVDFILSHCTASSLQDIISDGNYKKDELTDYLEMIKTKTKYKKWLFGHYHDNKMVTKDDILLYEQVIRIL